jgi:hypothetical protein
MYPDETGEGAPTDAQVYVNPQQLQQLAEFSGASGFTPEMFIPDRGNPQNPKWVSVPMHKIWADGSGGEHWASDGIQNYNGPAAFAVAASNGATDWLQAFGQNFMPQQL